MDEQQKEIVDVLPVSDALLGALVAAVNAVDSVEIGVTLNVQGQIVSGMLVGEKAYYRGIAEELRTSGEVGESIGNLFDEFGDRVAQILQEQGAQPPLPNYIHLKNAKFYTPGQEPIPNNRGVWWRGRMHSIDGFLMGNLS